MKKNNRIRELRKAYNLSQEQLAERVNTSANQISRLETGERQLTQSWMERIAAALGVAPADLLADSTHPANTHPANTHPANTHPDWDKLGALRDELDALDRNLLIETITTALEVLDEMGVKLPPRQFAERVVQYYDKALSEARARKPDPS